MHTKSFFDGMQEHVLSYRYPISTLNANKCMIVMRPLARVLQVPSEQPSDQGEQG
jgi:hypothetical protein